MTDTKLLRELIKSKGIKTSFLADKLGLSRQGFYNKLNGENEFKTSEVTIMCDLLGVTSLREKERIFFGKEVD